MIQHRCISDSLNTLKVTVKAFLTDAFGNINNVADVLDKTGSESLTPAAGHTFSKHRSSDGTSPILRSRELSVNEVSSVVIQHITFKTSGPLFL